MKLRQAHDLSGDVYTSWTCAVQLNDRSLNQLCYWMICIARAWLVKYQPAYWYRYKYRIGIDGFDCTVTQSNGIHEFSKLRMQISEFLENQGSRRVAQLCVIDFGVIGHFRSHWKLFLVRNLKPTERREASSISKKLGKKLFLQKLAFPGVEFWKAFERRF